MACIGDHALTLRSVVRYSFPMRKSALRNLREQRGVKLRDAAISAGVSHSWLSKVETGKSCPDARLLLRLKNSLDLTDRELCLVVEDSGTAQATPSPDQADAAEVQP